MLIFLHRGAEKGQWISVGDLGCCSHPHMTVPIPFMITGQVFQYPGYKIPQLEGRNLPLKEVSTPSSANLVSEVRHAPCSYPPAQECWDSLLTPPIAAMSWYQKHFKKRIPNVKNTAVKNCARFSVLLQVAYFIKYATERPENVCELSVCHHLHINLIFIQWSLAEIDSFVTEV